ncbi:SIMPL domain-containing protein [Chitinophaga sp. sic0106]|uniref:SIMPL domain-containing protein n=1 Tax=Chitinophaga sp. sic0106 TaxID=2854785 RepID=UPI001C46F518|nr:SIMPL domain-containing protein [Chitinophaga sp. sic0106]MBV7534106.1 SIMPL domain-containing protein [Chitinophaga sp. sic0106]
MKKIILFVAVLLLNVSAIAQKTTERKISVNGTAEIEVTPDEFYFTISLIEYMKGKTKVEITQLEKELIQAVTNAGVSKENLNVQDLAGMSYTRRKKDAAELFTTKDFRLKLTQPNKLIAILDGMEDDGIVAARLSQYTSSKMKEYRKKVRTMAFEAANEKALYLADIARQQLGEVLEIDETKSDQFPGLYSQVNTNDFAIGKYNPVEQASFRTIKVQATIQAVFAIK